MFSVETFFNRSFIESDLIKLLQFLEYDDGIICNPQDVNHHNANTGETTYKQLLRKCTTDITKNTESNDSFEFVLYKKCSEDVQDMFDVKRTIPLKKKQNEIEEVKKKGIFVITHDKKEQFMKSIKGISHHTTSNTETILEEIKKYQEKSQL